MINLPGSDLSFFYTLRISDVTLGITGLITSLMSIIWSNPFLFKYLTSIFVNDGCKENFLNPYPEFSIEKALGSNGSKA